MPDRSVSDAATGAFGPNAWLVEEMYEEYLTDPASVSESWREFFADYRSSAPGAPATAGPEAPPAVEDAPASPGSPAGPATPATPATTPAATPAASGAAVTAAPVPVGAQPAAQPPAPAPVPVPPAPSAAPVVAAGAKPLRGAAARIVENMVASLSVPTATSVHPVPAKLLEVNRQIINNHLTRTRGGKVSFTHLIGWAIVRGLQAVPALNATFVADSDGKGTPGVIRHEHVGLGLAVDLEKPDGSRTLLVPCLRDADTLSFSGFLHAYEDLIRKVRTGKIGADDFAGVTVTITNPGTLGTSQSVPRLMPGQGAIIGVGSLGYPPEYGGADPSVIAGLGVSKVVSLTSTYDHRIIQGAESGLFLARVHALLVGEFGFYDEIFDSLGVPYQPARWHQDVNPADHEHARLVKQAHVQNLINMYRVRGHLMANLDPLGTPALLRPHGVGPRAVLRHRRPRRPGRPAAREDPRHPA
jgi:2-oxoglutarate decarboxylase